MRSTRPGAVGVAEHDASPRDLVFALLEFLEDGWKLPDEGIWEVRGPRQHFTHSKVMAWVAFDRVVRGASGVRG